MNNFFKIICVLFCGLMGSGCMFIGFTEVKKGAALEHPLKSIAVDFDENPNIRGRYIAPANAVDQFRNKALKQALRDVTKLVGLSKAGVDKFLKPELAASNILVNAGDKAEIDGFLRITPSTYEVRCDVLLCHTTVSLSMTLKSKSGLKIWSATIEFGERLGQEQTDDVVQKMYAQLKSKLREDCVI